MAIRLYMDHDSHDRRVLGALRRNGIDVMTSFEAQNQRATDEEQLRFAAAAGRTIYTANLADFARLHRSWMAAGATHQGIIVRVYQRMPVGDQVRGLLRLCDERSSIGMENRFEFVDAWATRTT